MHIFTTFPIEYYLINGFITINTQMHSTLGVVVEFDTMETDLSWGVSTLGLQVRIIYQLI